MLTALEISLAKITESPRCCQYQFCPFGWEAPCE